MTSPTRHNRINRLDGWLAAMLMIASGMAAFHGAQQISPHAIVPFSSGDVWFDGDVPRVYMNMTALGAGKESYTRRHPIFILITLPWVKGLHLITGMDLIQAVRVATSLLAALWLGILFILLRAIGSRWWDAVLLSLVASASAAAIFWSVVPETWTLGSIAVMLVILLVQLTERKRAKEGWFVAASAFALGTTLTNWMAGIIASWVKFPWRRALQININALGLVTILWATQAYILPVGNFFLLQKTARTYILNPSAGGPANAVAAFVYHPMVMPVLLKIPLLKQTGVGLSVQQSPPGSASTQGKIAVALWTILLAIGIWAMGSGVLARNVRLTLGLTVLGQFVLHLIYGQEVFLYALHWLPLLIVIVACGMLTRMRPVVLACSVLLLATAGINNLRQFRQAVTYVNQYALARQDLEGKNGVVPGVD